MSIREITVVHVPQSYLAGSPPIRLAEEVHLYGDATKLDEKIGPVVTVGIREIVWDRLEFLLRAFAIDLDVFAGWVREKREVATEPCLACRTVEYDVKEHIRERHSVT